MAEVRFCFGRGAHGYEHKLFKRDVLRSVNEHSKSAINNSPLSVGLLAGYSKNCDRNAAHRVTPGYVSVTPVPDAGDDAWDKENIANYDVYRGLKVYSLDKNTRGPTAGVNPPRCWSTAKCRRTWRPFSPYRQRVSYGHRHCVFIREYNNNSTRAEPLHKTKTGYYDILEVLPSATQTQIKTAYYKQSFAYHPDRNAGSEGATVRFSEISEAYTVLGNKALRRKYDRGLLGLADLVAPGNRSSSSSRDGDAGSSAKEHTVTRRSVVDTDTREGVFDFDKFFKSYYSEQLQRERELQARREKLLKEKSEASENTFEKMEVWAGLVLAMAALFIFCLK
ncbi:uncharacterized protein LOC131444742 [Solea solea]|uniref:uncharacterized protein LOC131444742 n=1 Tax=Solea solea TaxID=90069 RepID=UPI00272AEE1B|nr:uncharacterized protein LOC131444742 [Solea solea]